MPVIAVDGDGVLLDYNGAYPFVWERAFGTRPIEKNAQGYSVFDRWDVPKLEGSELQRLQACFDEEFWNTIPAIPRAVEACGLLVSQGYELVCVTAIHDRFAASRLKNLQELGFPIERVIATSGESSSGSPKAQSLLELAPIAFVDDFLPYMLGVDERIHRALITRDPIGSPNVGPELLTMSSTHDDIFGFAHWWCSGQPHRTYVEEDVWGQLALNRQAIETFASEDEALAWLRRPHQLLDGYTPQAAAKTFNGLQRVKDIMLAIKQGGVV